jgi:hypothetical protein
MKTKHHLLIAALLLLPAWAVAQTITSAVPGTISYQGRVLNSSGSLVGAGTPVNRTVIFRIWDHPSNTLTGNLLYSEQQTVTIAEGEFSVLVGQGTGTSIQTFGYSETAKGPPTISLPNVFNGATRYLGVTVAAGASIQLTDNEITPRQQIVGSAFAFRARFAESVGSNGVAAITTVDGGNVGIGVPNPTSPLHVNGTVTAGTFSGSGANLTNLNASNLSSGTVGDARLTSNVALLNRSPQTFSGAINSFSGNVGIGTTTPGAPLSVRATSNTSPSTNGLFVSNPTNSANNHAILGLSTQGAAGNPMLAFDIVANAGYTIGIDNADDRLKISRDWGAFTNTMMTFTGSGDVGIGTTTPAHKLDVIGGTQSQWLELRANSGTPYIDFSSNTTTDYHARIIWQGTTTNRLDFEAPRFVFTGGRIGVGTTGPTCPLDVRGGTDVVLNGNYTSIRSEWFVQAFGYGTMSDQRIKQIVDRSSPVSDLDTVMKLKVTNYQMKAQVMKGNPVHKGLIAQEVEKVIPEAVLKSEAYVPEIFELAKVAEYNSESKSLKVTMGKPHGLAVGDMVMITSKDAETDQSHYLKVTQVTNEKAFVVGDVAAGIKKAFVFGKQVKDFRSVDYNRIYTTGIGAIQQIKREKDAEVKALKEENTELKARVIALEAQTQRLADLEAKDKAREAKLAAIEKLLLAAEKGTVKPVSLKKSAGGAE